MVTSSGTTLPASVGEARAGESCIARRVSTTCDSSQVLETCASVLYVVFEQLVARALFNHPAQQFTQGLLLVGAEYAEHVVVSGHGVADHRAHDITSFVGEVGLQNAFVLGVLLSLHQTTAFERGEGQLNALGADQ